MFYQIIKSPIGPYLAVDSGKGLSCLEHVKDFDNISSIIARMEEKATPLLMETERQITDYFKGKLTQFNLPLDTNGTVFQEQVWQALRDIPYGQVRSYQDIAIAIGNPKAVRAVGGANNRNPISIVTPCHRVIGKNGSLVGYGGGVDVKQSLLELENSEYNHK
ncbi:hypothetical protein BW721_06190 [Jeotgalibaca sp. PTS2502]|uniref:methylated-DNA--[protein]-cysteine S-methyltransferase n=1 Tax=Jeotgalibaca sp. PTS2502 TaxID=1903686 RepID=UPI000973B7FA|nr:methylated-DNA--[protein]-cysteine S-methyltransferase [Jeotgalibaca sp. PTS2502]APZ49300.1 hypothetical protein BW721_06190 [Jeotgalibaca sp. PTS2502]